MSLAMLISLASLVPYGCDMLVGNARMVLYGRIVDQTGAPVAGALVKGRASRASRLQTSVAFAEGNVVQWAISASTGPDGQFNIHAGRGHGIYIEAAARPGYTWPYRNRGTFDYGWRVPVERQYHPDPNSPAEFLMWNDKLKRVLSREVVCRVQPNGTLYVLDYVRASVSLPMGSFEDVRFRINRNAPGSEKDSYGGIDVEAVGGDVVRGGDRLKHEAPTSGYSQAVHYTAADLEGSVDPEVRFYTRNKNAGIFAGVTVHVGPFRAGEPATVTIKYTANFDGSPDLTPGPRVASH